MRALWVQNAPKPTESNQPENDQSPAAESGDAEPAAEGNAESANGNGEEEEGAEPQVDLYRGFDEEPFVQAAAQFNSDNYHGILELLTEAVDRGKYKYIVLKTVMCIKFCTPMQCTCTTYMIVHVQVCATANSQARIGISVALPYTYKYIYLYIANQDIFSCPKGVQ